MAAVEEERFNRIKHWAGFPAESIRYCLETAGLEPEQLDHVAISFNPKANYWKRVGFVLKNRPSISSVRDRLRRQKKTVGLEEQFAEAVGRNTADIKAQFHRIEHHATHVAAGFFISPFDNSSILSVAII